MKFVADVMLGSLARLMRFAGYDVQYDNTANDDSLIIKSRRRKVLTKDRALAARLGKKRSYLVNANGGSNQLDEILKEFPLPKTKRVARCLICNYLLSTVKKDRVAHLVPPFVFRRYDRFYRCAQCSRIYWTGSHYERMTRMIK